MASISTCSSTIQPFSDCFCRCIDRSTSRFSLYDLNHIRIANRFESSASRSRSLTNFRWRDNSKRPFSLRIVCSRDSKAAAVTWKSWDKLVLKSESPVLIEFYAGWCGPCQMVHRVIDEIAAEYSGRLRCFVLDTDKNLQVAEQYDVKAVPVILLFKNGEKEVSIVGTMPKEFYVSAIEKVLAS